MFQTVTSKHLSNTKTWIPVYRFTVVSVFLEGFHCGDHLYFWIYVWKCLRLGLTQKIFYIYRNFFSEIIAIFIVMKIQCHLLSAYITLIWISCYILSGVGVLYRLAEVLKVPRDMLRGQLAIAAIQSGDIETAIKVAK